MEEIKILQFREKLELLGYSERVIKDYPAYVKLFFDYLEKEEDINFVSDILLEHITAYHAYLQYNKLNKNRTYLSSVTIRIRLQTVKTFYSIMFQEKLVEHDYADFIKIPKRKTHLPKFVPTEKDMKILLESIDTVDNLQKRDRCIVEFLYATGVRSNELRSLTLSDLDLDEKTVFINGKGDKDRIVPLGEWVIVWLREYLEVARDTFLNSNSNSTDLVFVSKNGNKISESNLCSLINKYAIKSGISYRITPHSFRHACATHLLKAGADIRYVQELLGHSDLSSTQIYTKLDITFLKKAHKQFHPREQENSE